MTAPEIEVVSAAVVCHGRLLAARRTHPADVAGGWELPGGKLDPGETPEQAVVREVREELGCTVESTGTLPGRVPIKPGYVLTVMLTRLVDGEPMPHEHDAVRWLAPEELDDVSWLPADRQFLHELRVLLLDGEPLEGGNVGGAVRIGRTVRRVTGAWTESVHGLLRHLRDAGLPEAPDVFGYDERGREALTFLPGRVPDLDAEVVDEGALSDAISWLRRFHDAVADYRVDGIWRTVDRPLRDGEVICHHDFAPYNACLSGPALGERLVGVFDWDMSGPGRPLDDLAFAAWSWVPLYRDVGADRAAERLMSMAFAYDDVTAAQILEAVPARMQRSLDVILAGQTAGDPGMLNLREVGEPERTARALAGVVERIPAIRRALLSRPQG